jgi:hypothetical protein
MPSMEDFLLTVVLSKETRIAANCDVATVPIY